MAEGGSQDEFTELLTCALCLEFFTDPRALPCLHTFCLKCLEQLMPTCIQSYSLQCPLCKEEHKIPENGMVGFRQDFRVKHLADSSKNKVKKKDINLEMCHSHPNLEVQFLCKMSSCGHSIICAQCLVENHSQHPVVMLKQIYDDMATKVQRAEKCQSQIEKHISEMLNMKEILTNNRHELQNKVSLIVQEYQMILSKWLEAIYQVIDEDTDREITRASEEINFLLRLKDKIKPIPIDSSITMSALVQMAEIPDNIHEIEGIVEKWQHSWKKPMVNVMNLNESLRKHLTKVQIKPETSEADGPLSNREPQYNAMLERGYIVQSNVLLDKPADYDDATDDYPERTLSAAQDELRDVVSFSTMSSTHVGATGCTLSDPAILGCVTTVNPKQLDLQFGDFTPLEINMSNILPNTSKAGTITCKSAEPALDGVTNSPTNTTSHGSMVPTITDRRAEVENMMKDGNEAPNSPGNVPDENKEVDTNTGVLSSHAKTSQIPEPVSRERTLSFAEVVGSKNPGSPSLTTTNSNIFKLKQSSQFLVSEAVEGIEFYTYNNVGHIGVRRPKKIEVYNSAGKLLEKHLTNSDDVITAFAVQYTTGRHFILDKDKGLIRFYTWPLDLTKKELTFNTKRETSVTICCTKNYLFYSYFHKGEINIACISTVGRSPKSDWTAKTGFAKHRAINALEKFNQSCVAVSKFIEPPGDAGKQEVVLTIIQKGKESLDITQNQLDTSSTSCDLRSIDNDGEHFYILNHRSRSVYLVSTSGQVLRKVLEKLEKPGYLSICKQTKKMALVENFKSIKIFQISS